MLIKIVDEKPSPLIDGVIAYNGKPTKVNDAEAVKEYVDAGRELLVKDRDIWVKGKKYFEEVKSTTVSADINVEDDGYSKLFDGHWKKQVQKVKRYTEKPEEVEDILEYAKDNEVSDGVLDRVKDYLEEVK